MTTIRRLTIVLLGLIVCLAFTQPALADTSYTVQPGDTLTRIAARFGVTIEALVRANQLANPNVLQVGQVLTIPDGAPQAVPAGPGTYIVQKGDSLSRIAARFKVTIEALMTANRLTTTTLQPGQVLIIPSPAPAAPSSIYDRINGNATFARRIKAALEWLQAHDAEAYQRVETYIAVIVPSPYADRAQAILRPDGSCLVRGLARRDMSVEMVSALLYHEATHCHQFATLGALTSKEAEVHAYTEQIAFMERNGFPADEIEYYRRILAYYASQPDDGRYIPPPDF
jgi:LysM repeat protein